MPSAMLFNYLMIAARTLRKRIGPTIINILGLTVGIAACLLIGLWVERELSFDDFHPGADRIHRVAIESRITDAMTRTIGVPAPLAPAIRSDVPQAEAVVRVRPDRVIFREGQTALSERRALKVDSTFFDVFDGFEVVRGDPNRALQPVDAVVLTETTAHEVFGRPDVVGETLQMDGELRRVTAVMSDVPETSHLQFRAVVRRQGMRDVFKENWTGFAFVTYARLVEGATTADFQSQLDAIVENRAMQDVRSRFGDPSDNFVYRLVAESLPTIYLHSPYNNVGPSGSISVVYTISLIGLFILLIACINFMNLATARATERATEVGMRKALGAGRKQLAGQFLGEATVTATIATVAAFVVSLAALPLFNRLAGTSLTSGDVLGPWTVAAAILIALLVGGMAGSYPAFALSRFAPSTVLRSAGRHSSGGQGGRLRKGLVVFQFVISITLIIGTLVAQSQFEYIQSKRLGLDKERVVEIKRASDLGTQQSTFTDRIARIPGVRSATSGDGLFRGASQTSFMPVGGGDDAVQALQYMQVGPRFIESMEISVVNGRGFDPARAADSSAVVLNQAAVDLYGWENPLEQQLMSCDTLCTYDVIGVVENFHYASMRSEVEPLALLIDHPLPPASQPESVYARLAPGSTSSAVDGIREAWTEMAGGTPFQYTFLDQTYDRVHRDVQRAGGLFSLFAGLAILVACLGLFGLATYTVQRRSKEIGIRKAMGATATQVVNLMFREFVLLVGVAFLIAVPIAYVAMNRWLSSFAYRTGVGVDLVAIAGVSALAIALVAVSAQAFRAARLDPATTLRDE
ncbi:ABC transporter permease [Longibacter sp.]|uniref:ABC transporter permease n=1 Tax=Longibacter sp. TaxID=2045415 RepID=UPI003EBF67F2